MAVVVVAAIVALALLTGGDDEAKIPASAVATVGDTQISQAQLTHWQAVYTKANGASGSTGTDAKKAAFATLAQSTWILNEAERQGLKVTDSEVDAAIKQLVAQYKGATEQQVLDQSGMSKADLVWTERVALLTSELQKKVAKGVEAPSGDDISKTYASQPERWAHPSTRDVRMVVTSDQKTAQSALAALKSGQTFAAVTSKYAPSTSLAQQGGAVKGLKPGSNDATIEVPIFSAKQGVLSGPVKTSTGWLVFQVQKVVAGSDQSLQQATAKIKTDLQGTRQQAAVTKFVSELQKRSKSQTSCRASVADKQFCGDSV